MSVIPNISFDLCRLGSDPHLPHRRHHTLIHRNHVTPHYYPLGLIFFTRQVVPLALLDLPHLEPILRIGIQHALQHLLGISS